jgi:hypothetical protein
MRFNIVKKIILISILLVAISSFSQEKLLDYFVDKKGDTIYGIIRSNHTEIGIGVRPKSAPQGNGYPICLIEESKSNQKNNYLSHNLKKTTSFRYRGKVYKFEKKENNDGIYFLDKKDTTSINIEYGNFICRQQRLKDYIVTLSKDTIYGDIINPLIGIPFIEFHGKKIKINKDEITAYRYRNEIFRFKQKPRVEIFDNKEDYIRLLIDDEIKLYDDILNKNTSSFIKQNYNNYEHKFMVNRFLYIEKKGEMIYINPIKFSIKAREVFSDCPQIIEKIAKGYYVYEDLYSMVILYNYYLKHK